MRISDWSSDVCSSDLGARGALVRRDLEHEGAIGKHAARAEAVERHDRGVVDPAGSTLIGARRIDEAIGDHPDASAERRVDRLLDMIGARRGEQQRLGMRAPAIDGPLRSEEHTSELQSLMRISYAV